MTTTLATQIELDENGVAWVAGTRVKIIEVILDKLAYGWSPEEIHFQHPNLSLAQIHGAFAYYYENQTQLDAEIRQRLSTAERLTDEVADPEFRKRLAALKNDR